MALLLVLTAGDAPARQITDMAGRTVEIPDTPQRVYTPSPPGGFLLFTLNPEGLCGILGGGKNSAIISGKPNPRLQRIPNIGSLTGEGRIANLEALMKLEPDLVVLFPKTVIKAEMSAGDSRTASAVERLGVPYVYAYAKDLTEYPAAYEFLGNVMGVPERGRELAGYIQNAMDEAREVTARVPQNQRPSVYYAGGVDGLTTVSEECTHGVVFKLAGNVGAHKSTNFASLSGEGGYHEKISFEQVLTYNPDVIVVMDPMFYQTIYQSPVWRQIKAVQNKRVLLAPRGPFNWVDRPPSFMGALGLKWLLAELYPEEYPIDIVNEAVEFYRLFLWSDITHDEMRQKIYGGEE